MGTTLNQNHLKDHIHNVNFSELSVKWLQSRANYSSLKILQVSKCPPLNLVLERLLQEDILDLLRSYSHMFVIIIDGRTFENVQEKKTIIEKLIEKLRPLIVQVRSDKPSFSNIFFATESSQIEVKTSTSTETGLFQFLFMELIKRHKKVGTEHIAANGSSLDVRISKLLQKNKTHDEFLREVAAAMESKKVENFKAVLDLPIDNRIDVNLERKYNRIMDIKDIDLHELAIKSQNFEVVEFLEQLAKNQKKKQLKRKREDVGKNVRKQKLTDDIEEITADSGRLDIKEKPSDFKKVDPNTHLQIDFNLLRTGDLLKALNRHEVKMVTVENCSSLVDAVEALTQADVAKSINESQLLVLVVSATEQTSADESALVQQIGEKITKPMIFQFTTGDTRLIFYKEMNKGFKKLELMEDTEIEETSLLNCIDFETMCNLLHSKSDFGKFNFNLIETEVAMEKSICGLRLIDWAVKHNNMLCLMFLQFFNPDLENSNDDLTRVLEVAAENGTMECFEILLNVKNTKTIEPSFRKALHLNSAHCESLLMIAARNKKIEAVRLLIHNDLNVNHENKSGETASDIAWSNESFNILIQLLSNDCPFPRDFLETKVEAKILAFQLKRLIRERQNLHDAIENNRIEEVKRIVEKSNLKFAYDQDNQCALTTALLSKNFEAYSFLRSRGFSGGIDCNLEKSLQELDDDDRKKLKKTNRTYFQTNHNQHIMELVSKSRIAFENDKKHFKKIQEWFEKLDAIPEVRPILKIIASSNEIDIVFDFNNKSIEEMDPTGSKDVHGRTYDKSGKILIAAMHEEREEVLGTLAHELTHYVMQLVYSNNCLPFYKNDESRKKEYKAIVETYDNEGCKNKNTIVANALHESCSAELKMKELIVRVPHLLALYSNKPEVLAAVRKDFSILFDFFERKTLPDIQKDKRLIEPKQQIRAANSHFGVFAKAMQSNLLPAKFKRNINIREDVFIESSLPELVLESFAKPMKYDDVTSNHIFANLEQILNKDNLKMLKNAAKSVFRPTLFVIEDSSDFSFKPIGNELQYFFREFNVVLISNNKNSVFREFFESKIEINFDWNDLNPRSQLKIPKSKVIFQDSEVTLNEISVDESLLQETPLELLLNTSKLRLQSFSASLPKQPRVFIERGFQSVGANNSTVYNSQDICELLESQKTVIIADLAGMGKSISAAHMARELKRQHPLSWVVFIDLKQHTNAFSQDDALQRIDADFFSQNILKSESKFEQQLFRSFYENQKAIFIIDGFDEISPNYKQIVIKILVAIQHPGNRLLVTTRPHLLKELENELESAAPVKLMPFSWNDKIEFLTQFWQQKYTGTGLSSKIGGLLQNMKWNWKYDFYSTPIHISMLAEVCDSGDLNNLENIKLNIFSLYKRFIKIKLNVWKDKGPLAQDDSTEIDDSTSNLRLIHQKLALEQFFDASVIAELSLPEISEEFPDQMIARVGIVTFGPDSTKQFEHRTFAEYFAADFILDGIYRHKPQKYVMKLFVTFLLRYDFRSIRNFMDEGFTYSKNKLNTEVLSKHFAEIVLMNENTLVDEKFKLQRLVEEERCKLLNFVLKTLNFDSKVKLDLAKKSLHVTWYCDSFPIIWKCIESFVNEKELKSVQKDLLLNEKQNGRYLLAQAVEHFIQKEKGSKNMRLIIETAQSVLSDEEFILFIDKNVNLEKTIRFDSRWGETCSNGIGLIWAAAKEKLSDANLMKLVTETMFLQILVQHIKMEEFTKLWSFIDKNANATLKKELLLHGSRKYCLLEVSIRNNDKSLTDAVFDITESMLKQEGKTVIDYLREQKILNEVFLTAAVRSKELFEKFSSKVDADDFKKLLLSKTSTSKNILNCLISTKNPNEEMAVWNLIVGRLNSKDIEFLLFGYLSRNSGSRSLFHYAAFANDAILVEMLRWCGKNSDSNWKRIICERDYFKENLLHVLAVFGDESLVNDCLSFFKENFSPEERIAMFSCKDSFSQIPLQKTFQNAHPDISKIVFEAYREVFDIKKLKTLISQEKFCKTTNHPKADEKMRKFFQDFREDMKLQFSKESVEFELD